MEVIQLLQEAITGIRCEHSSVLIVPCWRTDLGSGRASGRAVPLKVGLAPPMALHDLIAGRAGPLIGMSFFHFLFFFLIGTWIGAPKVASKQYMNGKKKKKKSAKSTSMNDPKEKTSSHPQ